MKSQKSNHKFRKNLETEFETSHVSEDNIINISCIEKDESEKMSHVISACEALVLSESRKCNDIYSKNRENQGKSDGEAVHTYGGAIIDETEKILLNLPPDHSIYPRISLRKVETELEKCFVKGEWQIKKNNIENEKVKADAEKKDNVEDDDKDIEKKIINLAAKKSTDWKHNKRVNFIEVEDEEREKRNNFIKNELMNVCLLYTSPSPRDS